MTEKQIEFQKELHQKRLKMMKEHREVFYDGSYEIRKYNYGVQKILCYFHDVSTEITVLLNLIQ